MVNIMFSDVITLLESRENIDEFGNVRKIYKERDIFARRDRVFLTESIQAMAQGFEKQYRFTISDNQDYNEEEELLYRGKKYKIINTQIKGTELEINCVLGVDNIG